MKAFATFMFVVVFMGPLLIINLLVQVLRLPGRKRFATWVGDLLVKAFA